MKPGRFPLFRIIEQPTPWESWFLALFIGISIISGVVAAAVGAQMGWVGLLFAPILVGGISMLIWPEVGILTFVFIVYIQLSYVINNYHPGIPSPGQPLLGVLLFLIIWRIIVYGDRPVGWKRASIIFLVIGAWLISVVVAEDFTSAISAFQKFVEDAALAFVVVFFINDKRKLRLVIWALLFAGIFMGTISVFQSFTSTFNNYYWGYGVWTESSTGGVSNHRVTGPYGNPNAYSQALVVLVPLALDRLWHEKKTAARILAGYALAVSTLSIFFTYSRNGFLTLLLTLAFLVVMRRPNFVPLVLSGTLVVILIQFLPTSYTDRISTLFQFSSGSASQVADESFRGRISENVAAWMMFRDNPLFGVGLNNFQINYQNYSRQIGLDPRRDERSPASFYLELLSEQGFVGTTVFLVFMIFIFRSLLNSYHRFNQLGMYDYGSITIAFISGLLGYMIFYISKNSAYPNVFWVLLGVAIAIAQVAESGNLAAGPSVLRIDSDGL